MEYTSPGGSTFRLLAAALLSALMVAVALALPSGGQHHRQRHRYQDMDYEDSTVVMQPEFLNVKHNVSVREGDMASLPCAVRNLGTKQVAWRRLGDKDSHFLTVGTFTWVRENNIQVDHKLEEGQVTRWNLIIKAVQKEDEGTYQCQITDKVPMRIHVHLTVRPRPAAKPAVDLTGKEFVDRNDPILLVCNATGGNMIPEKIDWFKDGTKLDSKNRQHRIRIEEFRSLEDQSLISELRIDHADTNDSGSYICRSSDKEVDSLKVTVLIADTTNVKRGTGTHEEEAELKSSNDSPRLLPATVVSVLALSFLLHAAIL